MSIHPLMFGTLGFPELAIILLIVIVIFGANKLPLLGKGLGEGIKNFKNSIKGSSDELPEDKGDAGNEESKA